jgi:Invasion associated locus B (IalB) protein
MTRPLFTACALAATLACAPLVQAQQQAPQAQQPAAPAAAKPAKKPAAAKPKTKPADSAQPAAAAKPAAPSIGGATPHLIAQYDEWGAYTATAGGKKVCFALAKPSKSATNPPNRPRDPPYMFISSRPAEKVKDEVSVIAGYGFKPNSDASINVGGTTYTMFTLNDGAWIKNPPDEPRLIDAMRKGTDAVVKGTSARGTASTDTYGLRGLAQALDRVGQECQ